jgi:hypothetical protein
MSWVFDPSAWVTGFTKPQVSDFQGIATDLHRNGGVKDGGGYGLANTSYMVLLPGELPGTTHTVSSATWASGVATLAIGGHSILVNQRITLSGNSVAGFNTTMDSVTVTTVTSTQISFALGADPGGSGTGGTVLVDGVTPIYGMVAVDPNFNYKIWNGSAWQAATTAATAPVFYSGSGVPSSSLGANGDMYIDVSGHNLYGPKVSGAWGSPTANVIGPGYGPATSSTSFAIATGSATFTTAAGLAYSAGARVRASSNANSANYMEGFVTSYSGTSLVVNVDATGGSGTHADWNLNVSGLQGATGSQGPQGNAGTGYSFAQHTVTSATTLGTGSTEQLIECDASGGAFNLTLPDAALVPGIKYNIVKTDSSANAITFLTTSTQTMSGFASGALGLVRQWNSLTLQSNGANWRLI